VARPLQVPVRLHHVIEREGAVDAHLQRAESPTCPLQMAWRAVTDKDPARSWLRKAMLRAFDD
jgi:LysR family transcriptional activator of mexEF-oprN operon